MDQLDTCSSVLGNTQLLILFNHTHKYFVIKITVQPQISNDMNQEEFLHHCLFCVFYELAAAQRNPQYHVYEQPNRMEDKNYCTDKCIEEA